MYYISVNENVHCLLIIYYYNRVLITGTWYLSQVYDMSHGKYMGNTCSTS